MPSPRRMRLLMIAAVSTLVFIIFYRSGFHSGDVAESHMGGDFYSKTKKAMDGGAPPRGQEVLDSKTGQKAGHIPADKDADGDVDADDEAASLEMQERLKAAEQEAKDNANQKGGLRPDPPSNIIGVGSSAEGQKKEKENAKEKIKVDKVDDTKVGSTKKQSAGASKQKNPVEAKEEREAEAELNAILKKGPVVIFSKTYCPYSKRAKGLLLEKYQITPKPVVVELDEHPLGPFLQDQLKEKTGQRTVPNIMINGVSIGGSDDVIALDNEGELVAKITKLGNKKVEIVERFVTGDTVH